jgi:hypothetical protein
MRVRNPEPYRFPLSKFKGSEIEARIRFLSEFLSIFEILMKISEIPLGVHSTDCIGWQFLPARRYIIFVSPIPFSWLQIGSVTPTFWIAAHLRALLSPAANPFSISFRQKS